MAAVVAENALIEKTRGMAAEADARNFGRVVRERRRHLNLTQEEVARQIKVSNAYIGHLESNSRCPSPEVVTRLAGALGLDRTVLFFLAYPHAEKLLRHETGVEESVWEQFRRDSLLQKLHAIRPEEMEMLSKVAMMGKVRSVTDFIYILNAVRQALVK
jgi:transcriptional regulator with XRE-family HTH domain